MPTPSLARARPPDQSPPDQSPQPLALTDAQMDAILAASHPLPPDARGPFLEACARELAALPMIGDGIAHRVIVDVQRRYFSPPLDTRAAWSIENGRRSKLKDGAPIEEERDRRFTRSSRARV